MRAVVSLYCAVILLYSFNINASLDDFLSSYPLVTYDCPNPESFDKTKEFVSQIERFSDEQQLHLGVLNAHHLICAGSSRVAEDNLRKQLQALDVEKSLEIYARANYILGLALDFQEKEERCEWYLRARELSENKVADVNVSSRLGFITYCSSELEVFERLEQSYDVLQEYSTIDNNGLLAHIHNSIGLQYGTNNMYFLAAEQYLKAHELGLSVYTGANKVSILVSAISALNASGQYEEVIKRLGEFQELIQDINTPSTQVFYLFQLANYYSAISDFESMRGVLDEWGALLPQLANRRYNVFHSMFSAILCEYDKDVACVADFIKTIEDPEMPQLRILKNNERYKKLMVQGYLLIGEVEKARMAFDDYVELERLSQAAAEKHDIALQVSQLRNKIQTLQGRIEEGENPLLPGTIALTIVIVILFAAFIYKKHSKQKSEIDPTTKLFNPTAIINRIKKLEAPTKGKNHALVIFDIKNFREVNLALGITKGDQILRAVASTLKSVTRGDDLVGRLSPEQFIFCLTNINEEHANVIVERTQKALESELVDNQSGRNITLNSGFNVYTTTENFIDLDSILEEMLTSLNPEGNGLTV